MSRIRRNRDGLPMTKTTIDVPTHILEAARTCARTINMSFNQWVIWALAQRARNWRDPISGELVVQSALASGAIKTADVIVEQQQYEGWICLHGSHDMPIPAAQCEYGDIEVHRKSWSNEATEMGYDEWRASEQEDDR